MNYILLGVVVLNLLVLRQARDQIERIDQAQQATYAQARQANELMQYWFPPKFPAKQLVVYCDRCHK